jgi:diguanylate cyclase (GGDEF)-like protein
MRRVVLRLQLIQSMFPSLPQPSWWRTTFALVFGLLALVLRETSAPFSIDDAPQFAPGGALVLISFVGLGTGPGLLTALVSVLGLLAQAPAFGLPVLFFAVIAVAEAWGGCLLYRRFGSLIFALGAYWLTAGIALDLAVLVAGLSLPVDAVILLFVQQLFVGLLNALLAEAFLRVPALGSLLPARDDVHPATLQHYVFNRVVFVATIPALVLALLFTRTAYDAERARAEAHAVETTHQVSAALDATLLERAGALTRLARRVELDLVMDPTRPLLRLLDLQPAPAGFDDVSFTDVNGRVLARCPGGREPLETAPGTPLSSRDYFRQTRDNLRPARSGLLLSAVRGHLEPVMVMTEPLLGPEGRFRGVLLASFDPRVLAAALGARKLNGAELVTLLDPGHTVVASIDRQFHTGRSLRGFLPPPSSLGELSTRFTWRPGGSSDLEARLHLDRRRAIYERLADGGMGVLADRPPHETRQDLLPVAGRILVFFAAMLFLLYAVVARFAQRVSGPLLAIDEASGAIADGRSPDQQSLLRLFRSPIEEIRSVGHRFLTMRDALAYRDPLTGLPNRALFLDRLAQAFAQTRRDRQRLAVLRLGLDRFRVVQDTLGHAAGDVLLQAVASRLKEVVREADTVARIAADEFGVLVRQVHEEGDAVRVARKLLDGVGMPVRLEGREIVITGSVGLAFFPGDAEHDEALLQNADAAMHRAKSAGGDTYRLYAPIMNEKALEQLALEAEMRRAVGNGEFEVHYQPIVDLRAGRLSGVEALVRWRHPERGLIGPTHFIGLAEVSGLILPIGSLVLREAARRVKAWRDEGLGPLRLEVNLSSRQFQKPDLVDEVALCLEQTGLPSEALELEITESTAMYDVGASVATLEALRRTGVRISLDDFGTGYSSLSFLQTLPVDTVKLDQSFVRDLPSDRGGAAIATAVLSLARSLELAVIAEGVENREQLAFLRAQGCDTMQGFLFSRPLPAEEMGRRLRSGTVFATADT